MKKLIIALSLGILVSLGGTAHAQQPSDLLRIEGDRASNDRLKAVVRLRPGKGLSIPPAILGTSNELFDLLGNAPLVEVIETPIFDAAEFPAGPIERRLVFGPVTLSPRQSFFGLVGIGGAPNGPGLTEEEFRNSAFANYEVEVDGVLVRGDELELGEPFINDHGAGPEVVTYFNFTQRITERGIHRVVYRLTTRKTLGDCSSDCFPAGNWVFDFTIVVDERPHDSGDASVEEFQTSQKNSAGKQKPLHASHLFRLQPALQY